MQSPFHSEVKSLKSQGVLLLAILFTMTMVFRVAWITEDAFIVFRSLDQLFAGNGWGYNAGERVQVFTDPLYTLILALVSRLSGGEYFYTSLFLSISYTLACCWVIARKLPVPTGLKTLLIGLLGLSSGFVDFSTSGLENPLSHLLMALFFAEALKKEHASTPKLVFIASLAAVNRMDMILIYLPVLAWWVWKEGLLSLKPLVLYSWPIWTWLIFALFYFGNWVPNTALAKLNVGIPQSEIVEQGCIYVIASATQDPILAIVLGLIPLSGWWLWKSGSFRSVQVFLWLGLIIRLFYVVWVGGDYMFGRFLTEVFLASLLVFVSLEEFWDRQPLLVPIFGLMAFILSLGFRFSPLHSDSSFGSAVNAPFEWGPQGLVNERAFYYNHLGLVNRSRAIQVQSNSTDAALQASVLVEMGDKKVRLISNAGIQGFYSNPEIHWVDYQALCDPLIARLPLLSDYYWRTGNFGRHVPNGYLETISSGTNQFKDPALGQYYQKLKLLVSGPLFSGERLKTIIGFQFGSYDDLLEKYLDAEPSASYYHFKKSDGQYHYPLKKLMLRPDEVLPAVDDKRVLKFSNQMGEVLLDLDQVSHHGLWKLGLTTESKVVARFYKDGEYLGTSVPISLRDEKMAFLEHGLPVPKIAKELGYNQIGIMSYSGNMSVGTFGWSMESEGLRLPLTTFYKAPHCQSDGAAFLMQPNPGFGIFGPYMSLPAGDYSWELELEGPPAEGGQLRADVYHVNPNETFAQRKFPDPAGKLEIPFRLPTPCPNLELGLALEGPITSPIRILGITLKVR